MTRLIFTLAFLLGVAAVAAMAVNFFESNTLALTVTLLIGGVYAIGFLELIQFRSATSTLSRALASVSEELSDRISVLDEWLIKLHPSLHNSVRQRIEGDRIALPMPVLTPYLVGLLVMLGLLGTFVGLVETLKGVVVALEGTAELEAIREALTAPMGGLGLAFGTSVAGVAASAMLGLMSTLSKRDRMLASRELDNSIATVFQAYSKFNQQFETLKALERQSQGLPDVADKLQTLIDNMQKNTHTLGEQMLENQASFHDSAKTLFNDLAKSVDQSLRDSVAQSDRVISQSGRLVGEGIQPVIQDAMTTISETISQNVQSTHQQMNQLMQEQLQTLSGQFSHTSEAVTNAWQAGLAAHESSNEKLIQSMSGSFTLFREEFRQTSETMLETLNDNTSSWQEHQESSDKLRLERWTEVIQQTHQQTSSDMQQTSNAIIDELKAVSNGQKTSILSLTEDISQLASELTTQWQQTGVEAINQQQQMTTALEQTARSIIDNTQKTTTQMVGEINRLLSTSEQLIQARVDSESSWLEAHELRMQQLSVTLRTELSALREEEDKRGQAAVERLTRLESVVATHLAELGQSLEAPMAHLIEIASETPRAAADVIGKLRQEISNNIERDNNLLEERHTLIEKLDSASTAFGQSSAGQLDAIEKLVKNTSEVLKDISEQFSTNVVTETNKVSEVVDHFAVSAVEIASLGEAFTLAVNLFNESNNKLMDSLNNIQNSLESSSTRSDEQLGYYVAQAREVIDYSVLTQKEIFDELRQLNLNGDNSIREKTLETAEVS